MDHVGQIGFNRLAQRVFDHRVTSAEGENAKTTQHIQVALALVVVEIATLTTLVKAVKSEGLDHLGQLGVEVLVMELEVFAVTLFQQFREVKRHDSPLTVALNLRRRAKNSSTNEVPRVIECVLRPTFNIGTLGDLNFCCTRERRQRRRAKVTVGSGGGYLFGPSRGVRQRHRQHLSATRR